jgi:hypothetical protein
MMTYDALSMRAKAHMLTMILVFAALATGTISAYTSSKKAGLWTVGIFTAASIAAILFLVFNRNTYLPFLGPTVAPIAALEPSFPANATMKIEIRPPPGTIRVLYWASEIDALHPQQAYGAAVPNAGLATVSRDKAVLRFAPPGQYNVPWKGTLPRHVHWRAVFASGIMGDVQTTPIAMQNQRRRRNSRCGCGASTCPMCRGD